MRIISNRLWEGKSFHCTCTLVVINPILQFCTKIFKRFIHFLQLSLTLWIQQINPSAPNMPCTSASTQTELSKPIAFRPRLFCKLHQPMLRLSSCSAFTESRSEENGHKLRVYSFSPIPYCPVQWDVWSKLTKLKVVSLFTSRLPGYHTIVNLCGAGSLQIASSGWPPRIDVSEDISVVSGWELDCGCNFQALCTCLVGWVYFWPQNAEQVPWPNLIVRTWLASFGAHKNGWTTWSVCSAGWMFALDEQCRG